jgi:hypothetical protein
MGHFDRTESPQRRHPFQSATLMSIRILLIAGVILLLRPLAEAQTDTAAGVDAFIRRDYQAAAEILKPIAEKTIQRDYTAEFFMAALYESGRGVPVDLVRACAMYQRATEGQSPFGSQAIPLWQTLRKTLTNEDAEDCSLLARIGFNHGFQPVTFTLEPGQWISWNLRAATITYEGKEKRIDMMLATRGAVFLPVQHTELAVGSLRSTRRHFIEIFIWQPSGNPEPWVLVWRLFEVVRDELVQIAVDSLATVSAREPPTGPAFDGRNYARLSVNDAGDPELAVLGGSNPRSGAIDSDLERQEAKQRALSRQTADARVDWTRARDVHRAPSFTYADANGCGDVFAYGWSADRMEAITIRADRDLLQLSATPRTFDASVQQGLELVIHVYEHPSRSSFCTDVGSGSVSEDTWRATRGTVTIELSSPQRRFNAPVTSRATIRIVGAEFVSASGTRVKQTLPITLTASIER